ncbi:hypothetical protein OAB57_00975 [Bacteriovoracaceae bacterium]|nr:hypothetical protein [Bacteriovoracaceae bacterium]
MVILLIFLLNIDTNARPPLGDSLSKLLSSIKCNLPSFSNICGSKQKKRAYSTIYCIDSNGEKQKIDCPVIAPSELSPDLSNIEFYKTHGFLPVGGSRLSLTDEFVTNAQKAAFYFKLQVQKSKICTSDYSSFTPKIKEILKEIPTIFPGSLTPKNNEEMNNWCNLVLKLVNDREGGIYDLAQNQLESIFKSDFFQNNKPSAPVRAYCFSMASRHSKFSDMSTSVGHQDFDISNNVPLNEQDLLNLKTLYPKLYSHYQENKQRAHLIGLPKLWLALNKDPSNQTLVIASKQVEVPSKKNVLKVMRTTGLEEFESAVLSCDALENPPILYGNPTQYSEGMFFDPNIIHAGSDILRIQTTEQFDTRDSVEIQCAIFQENENDVQVQ